MTNTDKALPAFASNRPDLGQTVGAEVSRMFKVLREKFRETPSIAIATAYINVGGFSLLADELEKAPRIRLLLGAEPEKHNERAFALGAGDFDSRLNNVLSEHEAWIRAERDLMGFTRQAREESERLVSWLRSVDPEGKARVEVRKYTEGFLHGKAYISDDPHMPAVLAGSSNMTFAGLSLNAELNIGYPAGDHQHVPLVQEWFEHYWQKSDAYDLAALYSKTWEAHLPWTVFMRMLWELYQENLDDEKIPENYFDLTGFQIDGVARMLRLLNKLGGVLVADEVGLGKTFLAAEVIHRATDLNRQRVLIVCPAALKKSMWEPFLRQYGFRLTDVYSYEEIRNRMDVTNSDHENWRRGVDDYSMVVIDEAHNLRNAGAQRSEAVDRVILGGRVPKKVVLLTATPVNNSLADLETLIKYFVRDDAAFAALNIPSIRNYIRAAQALDPENLTPEHLFDLMDQVAVRRTRKFVKEQYPNETIKGPDGSPMVIKFPKPKVRRIEYDLDDAGLALVDAMIYALSIPENEDLVPTYADRKADPGRLMLARYISSRYRLDGDLEGFQVSNSGLLRSALLKRLESSPQALKRTLGVLINAHEQFLAGIEKGYVLIGEALRDWANSESDDLETFVAQLDEEDADQAQPVGLYHSEALKTDVVSDLELLKELHGLAEKACDGADPKVDQLLAQLEEIAKKSHSVHAGGLAGQDRRKVVIFSTYSDTILDVFERVQAKLDSKPKGNLSDYVGRLPQSPVMGSLVSTQKAGQSGGVDQSARAHIVEGFAPATAGPLSDKGEPLSEDKYDLLFTTDVLAEGVNLQQAGQIINYDLPWNPMRIVQRHGRVDRIGSRHDTVELGLFFPGTRLNELLELEATLERKLAQAEAAVGAGPVLPGRKPSRDINFADSSEMVDQMEELLENGGSSAAVSGEEFRRRLYSDIVDRLNLPVIKDLPYGSGSGFENPRVSGNAFVFCVKIADHPKPWFRHVPVNDAWEIYGDVEGFGISSDTLKSLVAADPKIEAQPRWLTEQVFDAAFDAWTVAKNDVFEAWEKLTDPAALEPNPPKAFRDAFDLVVKHGAFLGPEDQRDLMLRLRNVPSHKVAKAVRHALRSEIQPEDTISRIREEVHAAGLVAVQPPEPLPPVTDNEVNLVAWMAVRGTRA